MNYVLFFCYRIGANSEHNHALRINPKSWQFILTICTLVTCNESGVPSPSLLKQMQRYIFFEILEIILIVFLLQI